MLDIVGLQNSEDLSVDAVNGQVAVDIVVQDVESNNENYCSFDLILMDCNMPVMDGYEATRSIREYLYSKDISQPIIIGVTGHVEPAYVTRAIRSGMNSVYSKPISIESLRQLLSKF